MAAGFYSFLLARARWLFEEDTAASIPAAVQLVPYNSAYVSRLAAWRQAEKIALLHRAIKLNPFDFESLIQLGFASEFQSHDLKTAERYYLRAADVNKMFLPRWTLTNFYFRRDRIAEFFYWAKQALAITPYSPEPIFVQMWLISQDAGKIASAVPDRPRALLPYAWFLSNNHQEDAIPPIVQRLVQAVGKGDPHAWGRDDLLAAIEDRLVAEGKRNPALTVWADLVKARWLAESIPSSIHPVTNSNFKSIFYRHGFDWTTPDVDGVRVEQSPVEGEVRLTFSGNEPERCTVLRQYLPLQAGRNYLFEWQAESELLDTPSGLTWHIKPVASAEGSDLTSGDLAASQSHNWQLRSPLHAELDLLTLDYARPLGHLRAKGAVVLKSVSATAE